MPTPTDLDKLLDAALPHVAFDGWSDATFRAAVAESGVEPALAATLAPRGAVDLALAFHRRGDARMVEGLKAMDLSAMKFRQRVATAVRLRLELVEDREAVRRGTTLFALPQHAALGAKAIWGTADAIWTALGDTSDDFNWYTKRATLSGVYGATVLFWLGDDSAGHADTWAFLDRRIEDVMQIEKVKAQVNKNPVLGKLMAGPNWILSQIKPPPKMPRMDIPGIWPAPPKDTKDA
jgi:ubiquinone biosynthesis protein COQ9